MMASLFIYTLLWCFIHVILGIPTMDIICICIHIHMADTNARFKFYTDTTYRYNIANRQTYITIKNPASDLNAAVPIVSS